MESNELSAKKTAKPECEKLKLQRYGDEAGLTQAIGPNGMGDGGGGGSSMNMTGL